MPEHIETDLRHGAKAAAAAAAVGAAVGVARAIAARTGDASGEHDDAPPDHAAHAEPEDEQEDAQPQEGDTIDEETPEQSSEPRREEPQEPPKGAGAVRLRRVTEIARELLQELSGADVESVSALDRTDGGWRVTLEAVELRRIPDSTDVLATYEVELDGDGDLVRYERRRRYSRSQSDRGDDG